MKILIAPDSFKESLSAVEVAKSIEQGILSYIPEAECIKIPLADGGEGTVDAILNATGGRKINARVKDPLMRDIESFWGLLSDGKTGIIEMASASGLELLKPEERNPLITSTYGTGQLIEAALNEGCRRVIIGIGGSATNDGGAGMAKALGAKLIDLNGLGISHGGGALGDLKSINLSGFNNKVLGCEFIIATDVNNQLCGPEGASYIYGPQKGASPEMVLELDKNLLHYGKKLEHTFGRPIISASGAGAAGGLGAGLIAYCNAEIKNGFDIISKIVHLEEEIKTSDLVITGEGKLDRQTKFGKVPFGVAQLAQKYNKPVIGIAGTLGEGYQELYSFGFQSIFSIAEGPRSLEWAMKNAKQLIYNASERIIRLVFPDK